MVNSTYALRETTSKANSLKNRASSNSHNDSTTSVYSSDYFYTAKDPQYHQYGSPEKMTKATKKKATRKPKKQNRKSKTKGKSKAAPPPSILYDSSNRIRQPNANDVLCGRGGNINNHPGNIAFRSLVSEQKNAYNLSTNKNQKSVISQSIVDRIHSLVPSGRFLTKDETMYGGGWWVEVDNAKAVSKTSQALREGAPTIRAMAAADNKDVLKKSSKSSKRSLGKRKRASYKRSASSKVENDTRAEEDQDRDETCQHPLIVPMSNGHRGKQLIPRSTIKEEEEDKQDQQQEAEEQPQKILAQDNATANATANPCVSFDEDHEPGLSHVDNVDNQNKKLKTMIVDVKAETPPPLEIPTSLDTPCDASSMKSHLPPLLDFEPKILYSQQLPQQPPSNFARAHSLLSGESNGFNESFRGDENFVNPFLNESARLADFYKEQEQNMYVHDCWNSTTPASQMNERSDAARDALDFVHKESNGSDW